VETVETAAMGEEMAEEIDNRKVYQIIIPLAKGCISSNQLSLMGCFVVGSIRGIDAKGK
jgi:hypothetical protein